jgi:hypothetical protein
MSSDPEQNQEDTMSTSAATVDEEEKTIHSCIEAVTTPMHPHLIEMLAGMLCRAHRKAHDRGQPEEARAILHVAHSFADELDSMSEEFDRLGFIHSATDGSR